MKSEAITKNGIHPISGVVDKPAQAPKAKAPEVKVASIADKFYPKPPGLRGKNLGQKE